MYGVITFKIELGMKYKEDSTSDYTETWVLVSGVLGRSMVNTNPSITAYSP